jgi:hypothetical protein
MVEKPAISAIRLSPFCFILRSQRKSKKGDRATIAVLIFEEQLMRGKNFTMETRRQAGIPGG